MRTAITGACAALLACLAGIGCGSKRETPSSGPYVQSVTTSSAVVAVATAGKSRLRLRYGVGSPDEAFVDEGAASVNHGITATGLLPDTRYVYRLEHEGSSLGEGSFRTAPAARTAPCTFLVIGDSGGTDEDEGEVIDGAREELDTLRGAIDDENQQGTVVQAMLGYPADLALHLGDVVYPAGAREDYPEGYFRPFAPLIANVPVYPTLGNHDLKTANGAAYLETFCLPRNGPQPDERSYSFDWGCVHFVSLDVVSKTLEAGDPTLAWLAADLAAAKDAPWRVVYFHVPPFSPVREDSPAMVEVVAPLLEEAKVDLVLSGHDHAYGRFFPRGATSYVVSGGGGKSLYRLRDRPELAYSESVFHFLHVRAIPKQLTLQAVDAQGSPFDALVIRK